MSALYHELTAAKEAVDSGRLRDRLVRIRQLHVDGDSQHSITVGMVTTDDAQLSKRSVCHIYSTVIKP